MIAGLKGRTRIVRPGKADRPWVRRIGWPAIIAAGVIAVFCSARILDQQMATQSDGASMVLEAWAMSHGNPLLHGWYLADVTFYTTELPEYVIVTAFRGIRPDVVSISSALTYTLIVVLAAAVAYGHRSGGLPPARGDAPGGYGGREPSMRGVQGGRPPGEAESPMPGGPGWSSPRHGTAYGTASRAGKRAGVAGAVIAVAVLLGPLPIATNVLINDPDHVGSAVPVLFAFLLASRALDGRPRSVWRSLSLALAVAAVLGLAMVGDPLIEVVGIAPLVLVCASSALWRAVRRQPLADVVPAASLALAGLAAAAVGTWLTKLIPSVGGYVMTPLKHRQVLPLSVVRSNLNGVGKNFLLLFSASLDHVRSNAWLAVTAVHLIFASLVVVSLLLVLLRVFRTDDLVARLLAAGIVANLAAYALFYQAQPVTSREIGPVFGLGGALAGRVLGERVVRWGLERLVAVVAVAALAVLVPPLVTVVPGVPATNKVAAFLTSHHLRSGLGGYWQANAIAVETGGRVTMIAVHTQAGTILAPKKWELDGSKLRVPGNQANFMVVTPPGDAGAPGARGGVTEWEAIKMFGKPETVYHVTPTFTVLVWQKNLLSDFPPL